MLGLVLALLAAEPNAAEIMARVAENQERAQAARSGFVYRQEVLIRLHRGNRKLAREESYEYTVTPTPTGFDKQRVRFTGRYERGGRFIDYDRPHHEYKEMDIDGELISDLAEDLTSEKKSKDGLAAELFPLTGREQQHYSFKLAGRQNYRGRDVYVVTFRPRDDQRPWAGEVLIDTEEYQPVLITTRLARGIPIVVRTLLGTNLKHLGFKIAYERFADGIWFPVSYGGEFALRAVFFYKRRISLSLANRDFQRTDVQSKITYGQSTAP